MDNGKENGNYYNGLYIRGILRLYRGLGFRGLGFRVSRGYYGSQYPNHHILP